MTDFDKAIPMPYSIGAVERETGLGKDTLRIWERRYQFPQPQRDGNGERTYGVDQVNKLRLLKRLMDSGHRPGKIIHLDMEQLQKLTNGLVAIDAEVVPGRTDLDSYLDLCQTHEVEELRRALSLALLRMGLHSFVMDVIAPLNRLVGDCWATGRFAVFEEHLYTEVVQNLLRNAISAIVQRQRHAEARPLIILTTFPQEQHVLGLLMAEAMFALEGARCVSLGVQTPVSEIIRAAQAQRADIVALSLSSAINANQALDSLMDLNAGLPSATRIWAGGRNVILGRRCPPEVCALKLAEIPATLKEWHWQHGLVPPA